MDIIMKQITAATALISALVASMATHADIEEISPEELTEAYIKDTTVIIRKQTADEVQNSQPAIIKVSPLQETFSEGETLSEQPAQSVIPEVSDNYLFERHEQELLNQSAYNFQAPVLDPHQNSREQALQSASAELQALTGETIDLNNPAFPTGIPDAIVPPIGTALSSSSGEFVISIPNNNAYPSRSYQTPNGEYQIDITPDRIDFRLSIPQQQ